jgi:hypothetical protein
MATAVSQMSNFDLTDRYGNMSNRLHVDFASLALNGTLSNTDPWATTAALAAPQSEGFNS